MHPFVKFIVLFLCGIASGMPIQGIAAYPDKPVRLAVPFPPGGTADILARALSQRMTKSLAQPLVIENKPGADGNVGAEYVATAKPDGYTLLLVSNVLAINQNFYKEQRYDPVKSFAPISVIGEFPHLLVVNSSLNAKSLQELVTLSKQGKPPFYGSTASNTSLALEALKRATGLLADRVNFSGAAPAVLALISGDVQMMMTSPINVIDNIRAGKMRPIVITTRVRSGLLPNVPTAAEAGVDNYADSQWLGMLAPAGTPREAILAVNKSLHGALTEQDLRTSLEATSLIIAPNSPEAFAELIRTDVARFRDLINATGLSIK